jgi:hypothetical protein
MFAKLFQLVQKYWVQLISKPSFRTELSKRLKIPLNAKDSTIREKLVDLSKKHPMVASVALTSAITTIGDSVSEIFSSEEVSTLAKAIAEVSGPNNQKTDNYELLMGDRKSGYNGKTTKEIVESAHTSAASIDKVERLKNYLGLGAKDTEELVKLIQSVEPQDFYTYNLIKG